jgi:hypothetical protein
MNGITRGFFVTERAGPFFPPAIDTTRLGVSCYPTALLSNKLAKSPLKFQRVTAVNSLDFVQFLERKKETNKQLPLPPPARIIGHGYRLG